MNARLPVLVLSIILASCGGAAGDGSTNPPPPPPKPPVTPAYEVLGFFRNNSDSLASAMSTSTPVNAISMSLMSVDASGTLYGSVNANLLADDVTSKKISYILISNRGAGTDSSIVHDAMVTNEATTIANLVALWQGSPQLDGINIDFEGIDPADRDAYTQFVGDLAAGLHAVGAKLMLSVAAKTFDNPNSNWSWPYDYAAIGALADVVQVMTYDEHYRGGKPGAVAGSDWMSAVLTYAASQIDPAKLLLGLPVYGYDWNLTAGGAAVVPWKDLPALLASTGASAQYDATTDAGHFTYTATDGSSHEVWYETPQGIQVKAHLAVSLGLAGVSTWALGYDDADFWAALSAGLQ